MKKPLKFAAYSGVLALVLSFIHLILTLRFADYQAILSIKLITLVFSLSMYFFFIFYCYGFVTLARKFNAKLLLIMAWINVVCWAIGLAINLISTMFNFVSGFGSAQATSDFVVLVLVLFIVSSIITGVFLILFGVGLLKLKGKVEYAKVAGILNIIAGATCIILVGYLLAMAANIVEVILMFKASKKFEK